MPVGSDRRPRPTCWGRGGRLAYSPRTFRLTHRSLPSNGPIHWHLTLDQSPFKHNRTAGLQQNKTDNHTAGLQQNKTDNHTAGLQQNKTVPPATSGRSVDDLFVIAYQIYALALGLLIAYLVSTAV